jgi:DNA-binding transcriptional MerR regulator
MTGSSAQSSESSADRSEESRRARGGQVVFRVSEAARQLGVATSTLRSWELRYGLVPSVRSAGAHRRYSPGDIHRLQAMQRLVSQGVPTAEAARTIGRGHAEQASSIATQLRGRHPDLDTHVLGKPSLLSLSRAVEDEWAARGAGGLLVGAFQREHFYRAAQRRWGELARTAGTAVAFADFPARADPPGGPAELPLAPDARAQREWVVLCHSSSLRVCLAGWQRPSTLAAAGAEYETLWSVDPVVVDEAARIAAGLAEPSGPDLAAEMRACLDEDATAAQPQSPPSGFANLTNRMIAYLAAASAP